MIAALTVVSSIAVSVITGVISGRQAASNTTYEVQASQEQSFDSFVREKRQAAYADFVSSVYSLTNEFDAARRAILRQEDSGSVNAATMQKLDRSTRDRLEDLVLRLGPLVMLSDETLSDHARELVDEFQNTKNELAQWADGLLAGLPDDQSSNKADYVEKFDATKKQADAFTNEMREVLLEASG